MKFGRQVGCVARMNKLDFGEDPEQDFNLALFIACAVLHDAFV